MKWVVRTSSGEREVDVILRSDGTLEVTGDIERQVDLRRLDGVLASMRWLDSNRSFEVTARSQGAGRWRVGIEECEFEVSVLSPVEAARREIADGGAAAARVEAPIPGKVLAVKVEAGDDVTPGQPLVVLEAMKMENELCAEADGRVAEVHVKPGQPVEMGTLLVELET